MLVFCLRFYWFVPLHFTYLINRDLNLSHTSSDFKAGFGSFDYPESVGVDVWLKSDFNRMTWETNTSSKVL